MWRCKQIARVTKLGRWPHRAPVWTTVKKREKSKHKVAGYWQQNERVALSGTSSDRKKALASGRIVHSDNEQEGTVTRSVAASGSTVVRDQEL